MTMNIKNIRDSGLLELYVLGEASAEEQSIVRAALIHYPELKKDISEIEYSLYKYASFHAVKPSPSVKEKVLTEISNQSTPSQVNDTSPDPVVGTRRSFLLPFIISLISALGLLAYSFINTNKLETVIDDYKQDKIACDSLQQIQLDQNHLFAALSAHGNKILPVNATENYSVTDVYIHHNPESQKNYLQIVRLPELQANQSYQLWSLRGDDAIPLNVFQGEGDKIFEVQFVENTNAYAITIEPLGGQQAPTLEQLIGVIPVT